MLIALAGMVGMVGALTAGCTDDPGPPAGAGPTTGPGTSLSVPAVPTALDAGGLRNAPCDLIPVPRAGELGLPFAKEERTGGRVACTWRAGETEPNGLSIRFQTEGGLAAIAQQCQGRTDCDSWTVATISDYPVIRANGELESKYGLCRLFVGIADDAAFLVADGDLDAARKSPPQGDAGGPRCDRADRAATIAIQTLKQRR